MSSQTSNRYKELLPQKVIDFENDTFKIILMQPGFTFNKATHDEYADVSASELAEANGYTTGGATLGSVSGVRSDVTNTMTYSWSNPAWAASGGNLSASGAIIYDDTVADDPVIAYIDFGATLITYDGGTFTVANVSVITS